MAAHAELVLPAPPAQKALFPLPETTDAVDAARTADDADPDNNTHPTLAVHVTYAGHTETIHLPANAVVDDLAATCAQVFRAAPTAQSETDSAEPPGASELSVQKFLAPPPVGLIQVARDGEKPLADLLALLGSGRNNHNKNNTNTGARRPPTLRMLASPVGTVEAVRAAAQMAARRAARLDELRRRTGGGGGARVTTPGRGGGGATAAADSQYTFQDIRPLPHLPNPQRSLAYLHRLRDDVGVRHVMRTHQFTVGLLTEMDPLAHTSAAADGSGVSRTLGLNRNRGQVIELRLRTDAGDGYRDYGTVRRTLCHELAHNVHGPHDGQFWALCHQLEREVAAADYNRPGGGRTVSGMRAEDFYQPPPPRDGGHDHDHDHDHDHTDAGGWTGGSFVLGSGPTAAPPGTTVFPPGTTSTANDSATARRERMARAAEERLQQMRGVTGAAGESSPAGRQHNGSEAPKNGSGSGSGGGSSNGSGRRES